MKTTKTHAPEKTQNADASPITQPQPDDKKKSVVIFSAGHQAYAIAMSRVKEVVPAPPISPIPQTPDYIIGVTNVRGNVLAVLDLALRFGLKESLPENAPRYVIVVNSEKEKVAILTPQVPETLVIDESQIDPPNDLIRKSAPHDTCIKGVIRRKKSMVIYLDVLEMLKDD